MYELRSYETRLSNGNETPLFPIILQAIIASNGSLTERFEYIKELRLTNKCASFKSSSVDNAGKRILVLGSGHVCAPLIEYLLRDVSTMIILGRITTTYYTSYNGY